MSGQHIATHNVLDWLKERESNARRLADLREDKIGWLDDADHFGAAAKIVWEHAEAIAALKDVLRIAKAASIGVTGNKARIERAEAVLARATGVQS